MKPMAPHPGKVKIHADTILLTTPQLTEESLLAAPTPMMDVVFVCVVLTGRPNIEAVNRHKTAAKSAENPWYFSSLTISIPTDLMIR